MLSLTAGAAAISGSSAAGRPSSPASCSHRAVASGSPSRSVPASASQVFTKDCTTRSGMGAGFVSFSGTQAGRAIDPHRSPSDR